MCYSNLLKRETPNIQKLLDLSTSSQIEDTCDYLDLDSHMHLNDEPNSLMIIQLNIRGMIGKLSGLSQLINDSLGKAKTNVILLCKHYPA